MRRLPAWHPDSHQLAFQSNVASPKGKSTLWIVDLSTTGAMELGPRTKVYLDETPSWFSDGKRVAFESNRMAVWKSGTLTPTAPTCVSHRPALGRLFAGNIRRYWPSARIKDTLARYTLWVPHAECGRAKEAG